MKINFDRGYIHFDKVVAVTRKEKGKITYSSGLLYLTSKNHRRLVNELKGLPGVEIHPVELYGDVSNNYPRQTERGKMWCPFCMTLEHWKNHVCPVCGMSDSEFWVKYYNGRMDRA